MPQTLLGLASLLSIAAICAITALVGGRRERIAALAFLSAIVASAVVERTSTVWLLTGIDVALLAVFCAVAWRPRRGWPLWAVGLQGLIVAIDSLRAAEIGLGLPTYLAAVDIATCGLTAVIAYSGWLAWRRRQST